jgi:hypothetical protein
MLSLELEAPREALRCASLSSSASWHTASKAVESTSSATAPATHTTHLRTEHLHQDLGIDAHSAATTHTATAKSFHWINEVFTTVITCSLPI